MKALLLVLLLLSGQGDPLAPLRGVEPVYSTASNALASQGEASVSGLEAALQQLPDGYPAVREHLLEQLVRRASRLGLYARAEETLRRELQRERNPRWLKELGNVLADQSRLSEAEAAYREAGELNARAGDREGAARCLLNLGVLEVQGGRYPAGLPILQQAREEFQELGLTPWVAAADSNLGLAYTNLARYAEAEASLRSALAAYAEQPFQAGQVWLNLATLYRQQLRLAEGLAAAERAEALFHQVGALPQTANAVATQGLMLTAASRMEEAVTRLEAALKQIRELGLEVETAAVLSNLASAYFYSGRHEKALLALEESEAIYARRDLPVEVAEGWVMRAEFEMDLLRAHEAAELYSRAYHRFMELGALTEARSAATNWARILRLLGEHKQAAEVLAVLLGTETNPARRAQLLQQMAQIGIDRNNLAGARELLEQAGRLLEEAGLASEAAGVQLDLGAVDLKQGNYERALERTRRALETYQRLGLTEYAVDALENQVLALVQLERYEDALETCLQAMGHLEETMAESYYAFGMRGAHTLQARAQLLYSKALGLWMRLGRPSAGAFELAERGRARVLMVVRLRSQRAAQLPEALALLAKIDREGAARAELARLWGDETDPARRAALELRLVEVTRQIQQLDGRLARATRTFEEVRPVTAAQVQERLRPDEALLEYASGDGQLFLLVVRRGGVSAHALPRPGAVDRFVRLLARGDSRSHAMAKTLYRDLVAPADLEGVTRLFIAPEGDLAVLPFETLEDEQGRTMLERYTISYLNTARELFLSPPPPGESLVLGGPDYFLGRTDRMINSWSSLPGALEEARQVGRLLSAPGLLQAEASEHNFKRLVRGKRIIHVATHAFASDPRPSQTRARNGYWQRIRRIHDAEDALLNSGLVFSGANSGGDGVEDGILTAMEVLTLDLTRADLVVLSACQTGLGARVEGGEGLFGFRRSFSLVGARHLVLSLWSVNDKATRSLMVRFYGHLQAGMDPAEALRQAKLDLMREEPEFQNAAFWAPFVLSGAP